jgi:hypothetical protein
MIFVRDTLLAWAQSKLDDCKSNITSILEKTMKNTKMVGMNADISWYFGDVVRDGARAEEYEALVTTLQKRPEQMSDVDALRFLKEQYQSSLLRSAQTSSQSTNSISGITLRGKISALAGIVEALSQVDLVRVGLGERVKEAA